MEKPIKYLPCTYDEWDAARAKAKRKVKFQAAPALKKQRQKCEMDDVVAQRKAEAASKFKILTGRLKQSNI